MEHAASKLERGSFPTEGMARREDRRICPDANSRKADKPRKRRPQLSARALEALGDAAPVLRRQPEPVEYEMVDDPPPRWRRLNLRGQAWRGIAAALLANPGKAARIPSARRSTSRVRDCLARACDQLGCPTRKRTWLRAQRQDERTVAAWVLYDPRERR